MVAEKYLWEMKLNIEVIFLNSVLHCVFLTIFEAVMLMVSLTYLHMPVHFRSFRLSPGLAASICV